MSQLGQNAKYSERADIFRFAPNTRHGGMRSALRILPSAAAQKVSKSANGGAPFARTRQIDSSNPATVNIRTGNRESHSSFVPQNALKMVLAITVILRSPSDPALVSRFTCRNCETGHTILTMISSRATSWRLPVADVAYGSTRVMATPKRDFRSTSKNGHHQTGPVGPLREATSAQTFANAKRAPQKVVSPLRGYRIQTRRKVYFCCR